MRALMLIGFIFLTICSASAQHDHRAHSKSAPASKASQVSERKDEPRVAVEVPHEQQTRIGLRTTKVELRPLVHSIRTVGTVTADQTKEAHVHSRVNGWIESIFADYVGKAVEKGGPLFDLYSPEIVSTQEEYLAGRSQGGVGKELARAALDRLKLWGVPQKEIDRLTKSGKSKRTVRFESPVRGFIINKNAIQGMYITPGMELYQIADLSRIWIVITLYEYDISVIKVNDEAEVELPYQGNRKFKAGITYIYPEIEVETRTAKARIEIDNRDQKLKPGMYANVIVKKDLGTALVIPEDALIDTGVRKIVFVKTSASRFEPRSLKVGPRVNNQFVVLEGLKAGDEIVSGAHFFIDAESKLRAAVEQGGTATPAHGGH